MRGEAEGRCVLQFGGRCCYGRVRVSVRDEPASETASAEPRATAPGLSADGTWLTEWVEAAVTGAELGLELSRVPGRCVVTELHNPDIPPGTIRRWAVTLAAVRAVWAAVGFTPSAETQSHAEEACGLPDYARSRTTLWSRRLE